ncbi:MAG: LpxI family protein [Rickettsiales endosymbiont of Dermacentor nuttalli]
MEKIGIIAGGGALPQKIIQHLQANNQKFFVLALKGEAELSIPNDIEHSWQDIGKVGQILNILKGAQVKHIVLVGKVRRPALSIFKLDSLGVKLLTRLTKAKVYGDDALLRIVTKFLEEENFSVIAPEALLPKLITPIGVIGTISLKAQDLEDIKIGKRVLHTIDGLDIGQAVVVENNLVLGVEAVEGTDMLLQRCKNLKREKERMGVLVKMKKSIQDQRVDLPCIGVKTVELVYNANMSGIALDAGNSLIAEVEATKELADQLGVFIIGV